MSVSIPCPDCNNDIPQPSERCPHCGKPGIFWNVIAASDAAEKKALAERYIDATAHAVSRKVDHIVRDFEAAAGTSNAIIARSESEVLRLATSTRQLYSTYYRQIESGLRLPDGDEWDVVREVTDTLMFPQYKKDIRFGALSLSDVGLTNYGTCSIILREEMISHRTSVFEENSVVFAKRHGVGVSSPNIPKGFRATWNDRAKLCIAKLAVRVDSTSLASQYSDLLLKQGATSAEDEFIEVHIWGPLSALSIKAVTVIVPKKRQRMTIIKALKAMLAKHHVTVS